MPLTGHAGDDVLDRLAAYHDQHGGRVDDLLRVLRSPLTSATGTADTYKPGIAGPRWQPARTVAGSTSNLGEFADLSDCAVPGHGRQGQAR